MVAKQRFQILYEEISRFFPCFSSVRKLLVTGSFDLDQQIDGRRFLQVTDEEILQLLTRSNDDGTEQRPCLGVQIRFRSKLKRLKQSDAEERRRRSIADRRTPTTVSAASDNTVIDGPTVNRSNTIIRQYNYPITEENHLAFFKKQQFRDYLLEYVKRETIPTIKIRIIENQPAENEEFSPTTYTIQFNGRKSEIRTVRGCLRQLLQTIQTKEYRHSLRKSSIFLNVFRLSSVFQ